MRRTAMVAGGVLLSAAAFTSCTCHKQLPPPTLEERPSGFHAAMPGVTPHHFVQAPTPSQPTPPQNVAKEPTPPAVVPADFPSDLPIYEGAQVTQVQKLANDAHNVIFSTPAAVPDVFQFYRDNMGQQGWKETQHFERPEHSFISFEKGDMVANITVAADPRNPGKQMIAVMYEKQKPLPFEPF